ncbi:MAG: FHA domain-containing protein [Deltaproteobacteria bacterium]|nr:FHA domain-containing protein [Deltaproteobacteria bacterium]
MGILESQSGERLVLASHTLIGRQRSCFLLLASPNASSEHAVLSWHGSHWVLRDLGSRNGTRIGDDPLVPGQVLPVSVGTRITFGDPAEVWTLVDDAPPEPLAINLMTREIRVGSGGILALPDEEQPEAVIYEGSAGGWVVEQSSDLRALKEPVEPIIVGSAWMSYLPAAQELTPHRDAELSVDGATFRFFVSENQEHVRLVVSQGHREVVLEAREHYYLLLVLARHRLGQKDLPISERGWMSRSQLVGILRVDVNLIDVAIHRSRRKLEASGVARAVSVVEVRRGERRFGSDRIEIISE